MKPPRIKKIFRFIYLKLFKSNDTPQRIAFGLAIGVFSGILPGTGPVAALVLASFARANRASALAASLLTNTWFSFVVFLLSIKTGSFVMGLKWQDVYCQWLALLKDFHIAVLFKVSLLKILLPAIIGYLLVSIAFGLITYLIAFTILKIAKNIRHKKQ